ncbi:hypothetical protein Hanom_Chr12g01089841 [Helianthus anomalus]
MRPMRLEYVFGFRISFLQTIININRVITLAGGICFPTPPSSTGRPFGWSSVVELEPSLFRPICPSFPFSSSPYPKSSLPISTQKK